MPGTIFLLIDYLSYSIVTKLSIDWNCPGKLCQTEWYLKLFT